jgi:uncharacterized membrane protein YphA (DoxX/SURF4 family)
VQKYLGWALSIVLAIEFFRSGYLNLMSDPKLVAAFQTFGYPHWFQVLTGALEVIAAIAVLVPRTAFWGAILLVCIMLGALYSHLSHGQTAEIVQPLIFLVLAIALAIVRRPATPSRAALA